MFAFNDFIIFKGKKKHCYVVLDYRNSGYAESLCAPVLCSDQIAQKFGVDYQ
jgi:hypothetical protein